MRFILSSLVSLLLSATVTGQSENTKLKITRLAGDFYIYTTYSEYKGTPYPANGMYVVTGEGVILVDSPWDTTQFQPLLDSIVARHREEVVLCIATHFHEDRTGGLAYYRNRGIKTFTTALTDAWSKQKGMKRAEFLIVRDTLIRVGAYSFKTFYPGQGHAPDNIVIWFEKEKILYGGCLVKSTEDTSLGNLGDASVDDYAATVEKVLQQFGHAAYVIPGHNGWTNPQSLRHTLDMARKLKKE